jgi:sugar phosphate permease
VHTISKPKLFYGWRIVAVSLAVLFVTLGLGYYSFGVLFGPLIAQFGWSRAALSGAMSIFMLAWGLACPLVGRLTDRYGPRRLIISGATVLGACFCLLSLTDNLWQLYVLYGCAGIASAACSEIPTSVVVSNWFRKKRGIAMGITTTGIDFGGLLLAPSATLLILSYGWQTTFFIMGLLTWAVVIPSVALVMRTKPQDVGLLPDGEIRVDVPKANDLFLQQNGDASGKNSNLRNKLTAVPSTTRELWLTGFAFGLFSFGIIGVITHEVPFIVDMGVPSTTAATALGLTGGIGVVGKLCFGYFADRISTKWVMLACSALQMAGVLILMRSTSLGMVWAFVIVFGFARGAVNTLRPLFIGEFFGMGYFGRTFGLTELVRRFGAAAGPFVLGYIFDATGSYYYGFIIIVAAYLVGMVALLMIRPSKQVRAVYR